MQTSCNVNTACGGYRGFTEQMKAPGMAARESRRQQPDHLLNANSIYGDTSSRRASDDTTAGTDGERMYFSRRFA
jgi:hypothetical protein